MHYNVFVHLCLCVCACVCVCEYVCVCVCASVHLCFMQFGPHASKAATMWLIP